MVMMVRDMEMKEEGRVEELVQGRTEGKDLLARLMFALFAAGRDEDARKALSNQALRQELKKYRLV